MVKRTLIVLSITGLILMAAGPTMAQLSLIPAAPCFGAQLFPSCKPMYLPVDCPGPIQRTIVKTWECKIVGPCPAVTPPAGGCGGNMLGPDDRIGLLTATATALATPFDWLFGGTDGVYGCMGGGSGEAICGSWMPGPIPRVVGSFVGFWGPTNNFFGGLW